MKPGPLSNEEKEFITKNHNDFSIDKLSEKMNRSVSVINKFIETLSPDQPKQTSRSGDLMARNRDYGVVMMTEQASMEADNRKKSNTMPKRYKDIIHVMKEN